MSNFFGTGLLITRETYYSTSPEIVQSCKIHLYFRLYKSISKMKARPWCDGKCIPPKAKGCKFKSEN